MDRRRFLGMNVALGATVLATRNAQAASLDASESQQHQRTAARIRLEAAASRLENSPPMQVTTGDEERYADKRASFSKTLPHNERGEVEPEAYRSFVEILTRGQPGRFAEIPRAKAAEVRLNNPQAAYAYELAGIDAHSTAIVAPPPFASPEMATDMAELYWLALTRDIPYREYPESDLISH